MLKMCKRYSKMYAYNVYKLNKVSDFLDFLIIID